MFSSNKLRNFLGVAAILMAGQAAAADNNAWIDSASFEAGSGSHVRMARVAIQSNWDKQWLVSNGRHLSGYWDVSAAYWRGDAYRNISGQHQNIGVIGFTPVFRYQRDDKRGWYVEGGVGANLMSELYNNSDNRLSTAFEFGDHVAVGYVTQNKWDLGVKLQHYSNASIKSPNSGVNFIVASARYQF